MILKDIAFLASDTIRTKAYMQYMIKADKKPSICVVFSENVKKMRTEAENYQSENRFEKEGEAICFDRNIPLLCTLEGAQIQYIAIETRDINSMEMEECILHLNQKYIIYSGYGGYILKKHLFETGKQFIHIHAGILPKYRGSTTVYYSLLQEGTIGATAIFLNEGIDEGSIITKETFPMPEEEVDFDYIFDPHIRASVLLKVIDLYLENGALESEMQKASLSETYYIIHPVLKHLAILKAERGVKERMKML